MKLPQPSPTAQAGLLRIFLATIFLSLLCMTALISMVVVRQVTLAASQPGAILGPSIVQVSGTPKLNAQGTPVPVNELALGDPAISPAMTPWDGAGRVTILLLGLDYRDWSASEPASRSDTMILLTLDPLTKTAGILSIPRDLWVAIPGFQHGKINTAYYLGDAYKIPGGGPALAVKTVEQFLGVPINYYAQVDFGTFVRFIDEIGGVTVDVPAEITVDLLGKGASTKKKLKPGRQLLPGEWALAYARARYTEGGDFDRAQRQQQVIMAIRERILRFDMLPTLITKAPTLYQELSSGIRTNLTLDEVIKLALLAQSVSGENIKRGIIDKDNVFFGTSPDGLSILIPIPDDIYNLRDEIFATASGLGPGASGSLQEKIASEAAKVIIYNGSGAPDLGNRTAELIRSQGANVIQIADAGQAYSATMIIDHTGNPYIIKYLVDLMKISWVNIQVKFDPNHPADIEVYLGSDWARNIP